MNYEEAVERVLQGNPWSRCWHCKGTGKIGLPKLTQVWAKGDDERGMGPFVAEQKTCEPCEGVGWRKRRTFEEACELLGRAYPDPPPKGIGFTAREEIGVAVFNPRVIDLLKNVEGPGMSVINTNAVRALNIPTGVKADQIIIDDPMKEP